MRHDQDAYHCENNIITTNIVGCANNTSLITSTTSGKDTEENLSEYMIKEKASLKQSVSSLLAALDQIIVHPSKAEDTGSTIQTGISCSTFCEYFFQGVINGHHICCLLRAIYFPVASGTQRVCKNNTRRLSSPLASII
jgi:hypothetical protein